MSAAAYPITRRSLERLRRLVKEAHEIAASIRDTGPVDVRFEASNLVAGIGDVAELVRDCAVAMDSMEAEA